MIRQKFVFQETVPIWIAIAEFGPMVAAPKSIAAIALLVLFANQGNVLPIAPFAPTNVRLRAPSNARTTEFKLAAIMTTILALNGQRSRLAAPIKLAKTEIAPNYANRITQKNATMAMFTGMIPAMFADLSTTIAPAKNPAPPKEPARRQSWSKNQTARPAPTTGNAPRGIANWIPINGAPQIARGIAVDLSTTLKS